MTDSPAEILREWLTANNLGSEVGSNQLWPVYSFKKPSAPDQVIVVYNTTANPDGRYMDGTVVEHPGVQIYLRATNDRPAWVKGIDIQQALAGIKGDMVTIGPVTYLIRSFTRTSSLTFIGEEEQNKRRQYTINGTLTIEVA